MYLLCPSSVVTENGTVHKPLVLFCQRNWPEEWNSQTSDDEDILRTNSERYNFSKADEWYKFPIYDEKLEDRWSNKWNASKKRKCCKVGPVTITCDEDEEDVEVFSNEDDYDDHDKSILPSPISSDNSNTTI